MSNDRLPSAWHRELHRLLVQLGYELEPDRKNHLIYRHPRFDRPLTVPSTPSDMRAHKNILAFLRRRHPNATQLKRQRSSASGYRAHKSDPMARMTGAMRAIERERAKASRAKPQTPDQTKCMDCGRIWLSDLPPRVCPCGGMILLGRKPDQRRRVAPQPWTPRPPRRAA